MNFAVGYRWSDEGERFPELTADYRGALTEVYFSLPGMSSGRGKLDRRSGARNFHAMAETIEDLVELKRQGLKLDLLFNANCYGAYAAARHLQNEVGSAIDYLDSFDLCPEIVTTTSPAVAQVLRRFFADRIEVRASVNMRIDNETAMGYVADLFDSFYLRRDFQRDLSFVRRIKTWCERHHKGLYLLANSGCLHCCPSQTFHDNMVAHGEEADEVIPIADWNPVACRRLYADGERMVEFLKSSWIRPEDLQRYEGLIDGVKLATRLHGRPRQVIDAYVSGNFRGNLADLTEPSFSPEFAPQIIDNKSFPSDFFEQTSTCNHICPPCGYCDEVLEQVMK